MTDVRFCKMQKNPRATDFPSRRLECEVQGGYSSSRGRRGTLKGRSVDPMRTRQENPIPGEIAKPAWPQGKRFAFTIVDDTDRSTVENVGPVYDFLLELGL